jgi:hypothetical protein
VFRHWSLKTMSGVVAAWVQIGCTLRHWVPLVGTLLLMLPRAICGNLAVSSQKKVEYCIRHFQFGQRLIDPMNRACHAPVEWPNQHHLLAPNSKECPVARGLPVVPAKQREHRVSTKYGTARVQEILQIFVGPLTNNLNVPDLFQSYERAIAEEVSECFVYQQQGWNREGARTLSSRLI